MEKLLFSKAPSTINNNNESSMTLIVVKKAHSFEMKNSQI